MTTSKVTILFEHFAIGVFGRSGVTVVKSLADIICMGTFTSCWDSAVSWAELTAAAVAQHKPRKRNRGFQAALTLIHFS